jgi:predicted PurR-regulated permease PerM
MRTFERWMKGIKKLKLRRALALTGGYVLIALILAGVLGLLIPQLIATIRELIPEAEQFFAGLQANLNTWLADHPDLLKWVNQYVDFSKLNLSSIAHMVLSSVGNSLGTILTVTVGALKETASFFIDAFVAVVFSAYALLQKELLARQGRRLLYAFFPEGFADKTIRVLRLSNKAFSNFLSGQCVEVCILGGLFAIAMAIFGMPYIPLICVVIAVTAFVPIVGAWVGCIIGAFFIFVSDPYSWQWLWFCVMFLVIQEIVRQGNVLVLILLLPIPLVVLTIVFYPFAAALTAVSSLPTVFVRWRYALGALCSVVSLVCFMGAFQGLVETVFGLFGQNPFLDVVQIRYELSGIHDFTFGLTDLQKDHLEASITMIAEQLASIPAITRFLVCALFCTAGVAGEVFCTSDDHQVFKHRKKVSA